MKTDKVKYWISKSALTLALCAIPCFAQTPAQPEPTGPLGSSYAAANGGPPQPPQRDWGPIGLLGLVGLLGLAAFRKEKVADRNQPSGSVIRNQGNQ